LVSIYISSPVQSSTVQHSTYWSPPYRDREAQWTNDAAKAPAKDTPSKTFLPCRAGRSVGGMDEMVSAEDTR
jgi:hypothetical protein